MHTFAVYYFTITLMLEIKDITFSYGRHRPPVLNDFSANIRDGGIYGLLGRNGAGKSTLLYLAAACSPRRADTCITTARTRAFAAPRPCRTYSSCPKNSRYRTSDSGSFCGSTHGFIPTSALTTCAATSTHSNWSRICTSDHCRWVRRKKPSCASLSRATPPCCCLTNPPTALTYRAKADSANLSYRR